MRTLPKIWLLRVSALVLTFGGAIAFATFQSAFPTIANTPAIAWLAAVSIAFVFFAVSFASTRVRCGRCGWLVMRHTTAHPERWFVIDQQYLGPPNNCPSCGADLLRV